MTEVEMPRWDPALQVVLCVVLGSLGRWSTGVILLSALSSPPAAARQMTHSQHNLLSAMIFTILWPLHLGPAYAPPAATSVVLLALPWRRHQGRVL